MTPDDPRHGSLGGQKQHLADGERACQRCNDAAARYERGRIYDQLRGRPRSVHPVGLRRRVQALMRLGWTSEQIAAAGGVRGRVVRYVTQPNARWSTRETADGILRAYAVLSMTHGESTITRKRAEKAGWPPPLAWDDETIDDPAARPVGVQAGRERGVTQLFDEVAVDRVLGGESGIRLNKRERWEVIRRWPGADHALEALHPSWNVSRDRAEMRTEVREQLARRYGWRWRAPTTLEDKEAS